MDGMNVINQDGSSVTQERVGERKIDAMRGGLDGTVSRQWFNRPDDQRFTSLDDLIASLERRTAGMREDLVAGADIRIEADRGSTDDLWLIAPDGERAAPTNHAFQQMCKLTKAPYDYLTGKPALIAAINLQHDFQVHRELGQKLWWNENTREVRAFTGPKYGRILDMTLALAIQKFAGNGNGDTYWKVPGQIDWSKSTYNPYVDITKENTTLYASDRDVFVFLVDDTRPIEVGKLPNGDPDLVFRGFYAWNSETGNRSMGVSTFMLRGVCFNRNLWGVEDLETVRIVHTAFAPDRFARDLEPALRRYTESSPKALIAGIKAAQEARVAKDDDDRRVFLSQDRWGLSAKMIDNVLATVEREEGHPAESVWDFVNGVTAVARTRTFADARLDLEKVGAKMMDAATRGR